MKIISIVFFVCIGCGALRAELPFVQDTSFVIPGTSGWDIEYWMSDNTPGWATLIEDTIRYVTELGQPAQDFVIPVAVFDSIEHDHGPYHDRVFLCKTVATGDNPCVVVSSRAINGDNEYYETHVVHGWDLVTQELLFLRFFHGAAWQDDAVGYYDLSSELGRFVLLPPPPGISEWVMIGQAEEISGYGMGDHWWGGSSGITRLLDLATDNLLIMDSSQVVLPFRDQTNLRVAMAGHHSQWTNDPGGYDGWGIGWIKTYVVGHGASPLNMEYHLILPQGDASGLERLIVSGGMALNAEDFSPLWHNDVMATPTAAFLPCAGCDEILLSYHTQLHAFFAYDAATGLLIDNTSEIEGSSSRYVLSRPDRADGLVTFTDSTRTAHIYHLGPPPAPVGLTCSMVPGTNLIQLRWEPVLFVDRYYVFADDSLIADLPASQYSLSLLPALSLLPVQDRQIFTVKAVRD